MDKHETKKAEQEKMKASNEKTDAAKIAERRAAEDQKLAEERAAEDVKLDPVKREAENRRIDQERLMAGNPTTIKGPDGEEIKVTDGATYDQQGNEIRR